MSIRLNDCKSGKNSQHGEEGVIDAVFREIGVTSRTCVEFGAYELQRFSNLYALWTNGWRALLIEGDKKRHAKIVRDYAAHPRSGEQRVAIANRFVAEEGPDSLDNILAEHGFSGDLDLLCIDVDGTDFHIWRGLKKCEPRLVVVEYNPTIPPHIDLVGSRHGNQVGCSVRALVRLGQSKGYSLVACVGWNAFFVRNEHAHSFADADNLDALFDASYLRHAMQTYTGEVFYSSRLVLKQKPFCRDSEAIEHSSVALGRTPNTIANAAKEAVMHCLRTIKRFCLRTLKR